MKRSIGLMMCSLVLAACVSHRPVRNGLDDEVVYLDKLDLVEPVEGREDDWLFQVTVVETSSPNVLGDYVFPGFQSDLRLVDFRFSEDALQLIDAQTLQGDDPANPNDDTTSRTDRVLLEFPGQHVDVRLRETLNGERTNFLEENTELPWQRRQQFRVDFEDATLDPVSQIAWFYADFVAECANQQSTNLVPDSFERDDEDQYMSFVVEVNYAVRADGGCYDMVSLATGVGTTTVRYRLSFWRRPESTYQAETIEEKAEVNRRFGTFQHLSFLRDPESGLLEATSYLHRWDPNRPSDEPVTYYFVPGFPERFKPMYEAIAEHTNQVLEEAGATLRFRFAEWNEDGVERHFGDLRYSFVAWHQDIDTTRGLLGYGPSGAHPRTGELINGYLNLYNVGMDYYRYLIQDYLEENGGRQLEEGATWETTACEPGETVAPIERASRLRTGLFQEMRRVMDLPEPAEDQNPTDQLIPSPVRPRDEFITDYLRTMGELRYVRPDWNSYVYRNTEMPIQRYRERRAVDREFRSAMDEITMNESPFGPTDMTGTEGIEAMNDFADQFREWRRNHDELQADEELALARHNIHVFEETDAIGAISNGARRCTDAGVFESNEEYRERIIEDVVSHVAIHEFGHTLSLRHNFYGSIDAHHFDEGDLSSSVMDYVTSQEEAGSPRGWGQYDRAALSWIYGNADARERAMAGDYLYCTDEHRYRSPLCRAHDLGVTPSQITLNAIERYDWLYSIRNRRAYRRFWDTSAYTGQIFAAIFDLQRMWYLGQFDWSGGGVQDVLKRLDQLDPEREVLSDPEYDAIARDFYSDIQASIDLVMAFYDAVINQPASLRNYQTEFDPYYGDILRLGIITDKLYATFAFMDLQLVYNYDPNVETYAAMYDAPPFGSRTSALSQRVLDDMLGANYDTFPWFRFLAVNLFASATNTNLIGDVGLRERIAIRRYENLEELELELGEHVIEEATAEGNPAQIFVHDGEEHIYTFLEDQGWHLVTSRSRSPVSFQSMREYNEDLNAGRRGDLDNYGIKTLLAYYEYYNNFVGF
ncbi:zinc-dependent metalloprotease [Sandaracinus amylolyticus]|uniref:zinc-dependent metalloprotease n=1 Tax=Sandaracinus amylolyticus TaxID=927083 RepID=UPI0009F9D642|nr:zinc-dependent metalloprotease [Sandaracinus amylolyticus]